VEEGRSKRESGEWKSEDADVGVKGKSGRLTLGVEIIGESAPVSRSEGIKEEGKKARTNP
jgi:hypothetical protein